LDAPLRLRQRARTASLSGYDDYTKRVRFRFVPLVW